MEYHVLPMQELESYRVAFGDLEIQFLSSMQVLSNDYSDIHYHTCFEIQYMTEGSNSIESGETVYPMVRGDVLWIPPNTLHRNLVTEGEQFQRISFSVIIGRNAAAPAGINEAFSEYLDYSRIFASAHGTQFIQSNSVAQHFRTLLRWIGQPEYRHRIPALLSLIFCEIADAIQQKNIIYASASLKEADQLSITDQKRKFLIEQFIALHYNSSTATEELMELLHLSRRHTDRVVRTLMGESLSVLLIRQRMHTAQILLRHTDKPITEIAHELGYTSYVGFYSTFRAALGCSPDEYRNRRNL